MDPAIRHRAAKIIGRLAGDFWLFCRVAVRTFDENEKNPVLKMSKPFPQYAYLRKVAEAFEAERNVIVLKPRQMGLSWLVVAYAVWKTIMHPNERVLIVSKREKDSFHLRDRAVAILDNLPSVVRLTLDRRASDTRSEICFANGSAIHFLPASPSIGRTYTATCVILDEAAFLPDAERMYASLAPTLSGGGRLLALSTPNGVGGLFHTLWVNAKDRGFHRVELHWSDHPDRDQRWFDETSTNLSKRDVAQEYLCDFLQSGAVVFVSEHLRLIRDPMSDIERVEIIRSSQRQQQRHPFLIGVDVGEGHSDSDFSAATVLHNGGEEFTQAETIAGRWRPDIFAERIAELASRYPGRIGVEKNGPGGVVILELERMGLRGRLYRHREWDQRGRIKTRVGWVTSTKSKPVMIGELEIALRNGDILLSDPDTLEELRAYEYTGSSSLYTSAPSGFHDDHVIALAIAYQMRKTGDGVKMVDRIA